MLDFAAARCAHCDAWQVQRAGKVKPVFACKLCGAKQTLLTLAGRSSSAAEMRLLVQSLNTARNDPQAVAAAAAARQHALTEQREADAAACDVQGLKRGRWEAFVPRDEEAIATSSEALPAELLRRWAGRAVEPAVEDAPEQEARERVLSQLPAQRPAALSWVQAGGKPSLASRWAAAAPDEDW